MLSSLLALDYKVHLVISLVTRLVLICYGEYHDKISEVPYTDIDYKVFTDASRHVLAGNSPYSRHTFRYSPLLALILIPNVMWHRAFGKILFCMVDVLVGLLIRIIVKNSIQAYQPYEGPKKYGPDGKQISRRNKPVKTKIHRSNDAEEWADYSMLSWLYNPMTLAISTRGNCDSLACLLILTTVYFLQYRRAYFVAGLLHGLSIHFRLFPVIYSLTYFMFLSSYSYYGDADLDSRKGGTGCDSPQNSVANTDPYGRTNTIFKKKYLLYFMPNKNQWMLVCGCCLSLTALTGVFYSLYGYEFLYQTYIYHFVRSDPRHSFSLYFYQQYLTAWIENVGLWQKILTVLPQIVLLFVFSVRYGLNRLALNFAILTQTIVMVIYNRVITSQYFVWIMGILPLCIWQLKMSRKLTLALTTVWFLAQGAWLLPAYFLEYRGQNTFMLIWLQGVSFFCVNVAILGRMVTYFMTVRAKTT
ncbi:GPI mannosyltransferase 1 [Cylas formicarius]|uniref:GPI mannosyltransferase 1 n=1 Tax=Cylas formicarius TaxID=197179 RepID=UPI002958ADA1|nr:GPI mannosyltransferase 1 [Cylas formicarius]